ALDGFVADEIRDPLDELRLVDLIRNLREDNRGLVALLAGLERRSRPHQDRPASGGIRLDDAAAADDVAACREVGPRNETNQLLDFLGAGCRRRLASLAPLRRREIGVFDQPDAAVDDLAQVV